MWRRLHGIGNCGKSLAHRGALGIGGLGSEPMRETRIANISHFGTCAPSKICFLCQMPAELTKDLIIARPNSVYHPRTTLFAENQPSRGVFILGEGEARVSINSSAGKTLILRIAGAGELLGLMDALSGRPYCNTVEAITPCHIGFVRREDFVRFVTTHPQALEPIASRSS